MLMLTGSDSIIASTDDRKHGMTLSNESGKLIPSRRGHDSHVAVCGSHSAGIRYRSAAGVFVIASIWMAKVQQPAMSASRIGVGARMDTVSARLWRGNGPAGAPVRLLPRSQRCVCRNDFAVKSAFALLQACKSHRRLRQ